MGCMWLLIQRGDPSGLKKLKYDMTALTISGQFVSVVLTVFAVDIAWVFFRAESFSGAIIILKGLVGLNGILIPEQLSFLVPDCLSQVVSASFDYRLFNVL